MFQVSEPARVQVRVRGPDRGEVRVVRRGWAPPRPQSVVWPLRLGRRTWVEPGRYVLEVITGNGDGRHEEQVRRLRLGQVVTLG